MFPGILALAVCGALAYLAYYGIGHNYLTVDQLYHEWIPPAVAPAVAGMFIALLVPWANYFYWKRRAKNEREWNKENLKREIVSNVAELLDGALLNIDRLAELKDEEPALTSELRIEHHKERYNVYRAKLEAEKGIGKIARLMEVYYSPEAVEKMGDWINLYNDVRDTHKRFKPDDPLVSKAIYLLKQMRSELDLN